MHHDASSLVPTETTAGQTFQSSTTINNNGTADRLKCDALQSSAGESAAEVSRFGGRILRKEERKAPGGSLAVSGSIARINYIMNHIILATFVIIMSFSIPMAPSLSIISIGSNKRHCDSQEKSNSYGRHGCDKPI